MSFERGDYGISKPRVSLRTAPDGRKTFYSDNFQSGTAAVGRRLINAICSDGKICTVGSPESVARKAKVFSKAENLIYDIGPGTETGKNEFYCSGRGEMSDTFSSDGKLISKTVTFDKSNDGENAPDDANDYIYFKKALEKKRYLFRIVLDGEATHNSLAFRLADENGNIKDSQSDYLLYSGDGAVASVYFAFNVSQAGNYRICIAPVYPDPMDYGYGGFETEEEYEDFFNRYSVNIKRLYLFDTASAAEDGIYEYALRTIDFDGRFYQHTEEVAFQGTEIYASCKHGGNIYFATDKCVYRMNGSDVYRLVSGRHGTQGAFFTFGSGLYFTDADRVFQLFDYKSKTVADEPSLYTDCACDGSLYTAKKKNPLSIYAKVTFESSRDEARVIPAAIGHKSDYYAVYDGNGRTLSSSEYTVSEAGGKTTVTIKNALPYHRYSVKLKLSDAELAKFGGIREAFFGRVIIDEGSGSGGEKVMCYYENKVYVLTLTGAFAADASALSVSAGDRITALISSGEDRFVFTERSVRKVFCGGSSLSVAPFKNGFGCDIPLSAVCEGDDICFASTYGGIYFIDKDNESSENVCRRVSAYVGDEFSAMVASGRKLEGIISGGKYFLFAGREAVVWDIGGKRPAAALSENDEKKLVWYRASLDSFYGAIISEGNRIYYFCESGVGCFGFSKGEGNGRFESERFYPEGLFAEKRISKISVSAKLGKALTLRFRLDGELQPDEYTLCPEERPIVYTVDVPGREFYGFSLELSGGDFEIYGVGAEYYI